MQKKFSLNFKTYFYQKHSESILEKVFPKQIKGFDNYDISNNSTDIIINYICEKKINENSHCFNNTISIPIKYAPL